MAILEITDGCGGINVLLAPMNLLRVMCFPDDEDARNQWLEAAAVFALDSAPDKRIAESLTIGELSRLTSAARSSDELMRRAVEGGQHGWVAANILWLVLSLAGSAPQHATVHKAIHVMGVHAARSRTHVSERLPGDTTTIKMIWARFKPVSHLWAAIEYQRRNIGYGGTKAGNGFMSAERLPQFLAVAEQIRLRGIGHRPPGGRINSIPLKVSTLDPETAWKPPADLALPMVNVKMPIPPEWVLKELGSYRADR
jgi:hypothetical protein